MNVQAVPGETLVNPEILLRNHPIFLRVSSATVQRVVDNVQFVSYAAGSRMIAEDVAVDTVFFLLHGVVRILHNRHDESFSPKLLLAPSQFGHLEMLAGSNVAAQTVKVVESALVGEVPWPVIRELLAMDHALALACLEDLATQFLHTADTAKQMAFGGLVARIVNVLLSYAEVDCKEENQMTLGTLVNHQKIAEHIASPRRSVIRIMQQLCSQGLIGYSDDGRIMLLDVPRLERKLHGRRVGLTHRARPPSLVAAKEPGNLLI